MNHPAPFRSNSPIHCVMRIVGHIQSVGLYEASCPHPASKAHSSLSHQRFRGCGSFTWSGCYTRNTASCTALPLKGMSNHLGLDVQPCGLAVRGRALRSMAEIRYTACSPTKILINFLIRMSTPKMQKSRLEFCGNSQADYARSEKQCSPAMVALDHFLNGWPAIG